MSVPVADLLRILPELVLAAFGTLIVLVEPFLRRTQKSLTGYIALIGALLALLSTLAPAMNPGPAFNGLVLVDGFSIFFHFLLLVITTLTIVASFRYLEREGLPQGEFYALLLFATIGMGLMASGNELVLVFLGLETVSIATYVLVGFRRTAVRSNEAAMKYFLLGSFATAFMLYGIALLFGATGTTFLPDIARQLAEGGGMRTLALMGMGLLFVGLGFKLALVPFQAWVPDVYEGAPTPVTAFLSAGPKAAVLAAFLRIFFTALEPLSGSWVWVIWASAILTMCIGNLGALMQDNIKRMLAYSSIAHVGYILIAFAAHSELGIAAVLFYLVAYALMKLGAFSIVSHVSAGEANQSIDDYAGLHARHPLLAACLTVFLLSLIGIPLTGGFFGKLYIFAAGIDANLMGLVIVGVVNSALSAAYYLRVVKVMYMNEPQENPATVPVPASLVFVLTLTVLGTIGLGVFPSPILQFAQQSVLPLP